MIRGLATDYVEEGWVSPIVVLRLLEAGDGISAAKALIGLALNSSTLAPTLEVSLAAAQVYGPLVRGNALLSLDTWLADLASSHASRYMILSLVDWSMPMGMFEGRQTPLLTILNSSWAGILKDRKVCFRPEANLL
jgi:hypothetical protein